MAKNNSIPGYWEDGPHDPIEIEKTWRNFIKKFGGSVVEELIPPPREFPNADFIIEDKQVVLELKEITTEFARSNEFNKSIQSLNKKLIKHDQRFMYSMYIKGVGYPQWYLNEYNEILKKRIEEPIKRILKKANTQIKETKKHFNYSNNKGVLLIVNDGFTDIRVEAMMALQGKILSHLYSSIDCCVYLTINSYIDIPNNPTPSLLWAPLYSNKADAELQEFINKLGDEWLKYLEELTGPFTSHIRTDDSSVISGATYLQHPDLPRSSK